MIYDRAIPQIRNNQLTTTISGNLVPAHRRPRCFKNMKQTSGGNIKDVKQDFLKNYTINTKNHE